MASLEVSTADVARILTTGDDVQLVDVREAFELERGVLPGAIHVPMSQMLERHAEIRIDGDVIVYCEHGVRSYDVVAWLAQEQGHTNARSMDGGFCAWAGPVVPFEHQRS